MILCILCIATLSTVCCAFQPQHTFPLAFAGFGGGSNKGKSKGKGKGKKKKQNKVTPNNNHLFTPEGRMDHIKARIAAADLSQLQNFHYLEPQTVN